MRRIYVDKYTGRLERTDIYRVRLILRDGTVIEDLEPRRLFPFSNYTMYITLLDSNEREVAIIRDYDELDEESMKVRYRAYVSKCKKEHRPILVGEKDFTDIKDMRSAIEFPHTPVGHAFVVKSLLQGDLEVVDGNVIDHMGLAA